MDAKELANRLRCNSTEEKRQRVQLREKEGASEKWESPLRVQLASGARVRDGGKCFSAFLDIFVFLPLCRRICVFCSLLLSKGCKEVGEIYRYVCTLVITEPNLYVHQSFTCFTFRVSVSYLYIFFSSHMVGSLWDITLTFQSDA